MMIRIALHFIGATGVPENAMPVVKAAPPRIRREDPKARSRIFFRLGVAVVIALGLYFRFVAVLAQPLWVDEAESSIN
ncbi:MAG TPA: hypothetical protein VIM71_16120, partial [Lacunisphaera sp.]